MSLNELPKCLKGVDPVWIAFRMFGHSWLPQLNGVPRVVRSKSTGAEDFYYFLFDGGGWKVETHWFDR